MRFHNNQVWRSEESHFQLLKLNLALKLDSYTYPKNSSLHISHKHSLKWTPNTLLMPLRIFFPIQNDFSVAISGATVIPEKLSSIDPSPQQTDGYMLAAVFCSQALDVMLHLYESPKSKTCHTLLSVKCDRHLSQPPLQSHFPQGRWHLNSSPVIRGCSEEEKRICFCTRVSVYVNVNICVHAERLQEEVQNHREKDCNAFGDTKITFQLIVFQSFFLRHQFSPLNVYLHTHMQYSSPCIYVNVYSTTVNMIAFADISITFPISNCCQLWKVICSSVPTFLGPVCIFFTHIGICTNKTIYTKILTTVCM